MTTKMISAVMIVVIILGAQASCLRLAGIRAAAVTHPLTQVVLTAYCFLYFARTVVLMFPRTLKSPSISTLRGAHAFTKSSRMIFITCS